MSGGRRAAMRVVVLDYPPYAPYAAEARACAAVGAELVVLPYERFAAEPSACDVLLDACGGPVGDELLARCGCATAVGYGVGLDWIDLDAARRRGVRVVRMPLANVPDVALHALALMLACARQLLQADALVRAGTFDCDPLRPLPRLAARRLGLVAFGNIPRELTRLLAPLGMRIAAHDPYLGDEVVRSYGVEPVAELDALVARSDVLSVHAPAPPHGQPLLDARRLALLPHGAIVVVTSRGAVYDADALARALADRRIAAAGLDVFPAEPLPPGDPLTLLPNVILTPHMAGTSEESIAAQHEAAAEAILEAAASWRMSAASSQTSQCSQIRSPSKR